MSMTRAEIVNAALDEPDKLTVWQYDFINTIAEYEHLDHLTPLQVAGLQTVAERLELDV